MINSLHLNASTSGGAGRAAYRIHKSLANIVPDLSSRMLVLSSDINDNSVCVLKQNWKQRLLGNILSRIETYNISRMKTQNYNYHSTGFPGSGLVTRLNQDPSKILNIHSIGEGMFSIEDISHLAKPLVWTMHDEWGYSGAEHYSELDQHCSTLQTTLKRYEMGYVFSNRPASERGPDINRLTWRRKMKAWTKPIHIVCPSKWLASCASRSKLMKSWPISVIPYPIAVDTWNPIDMAMARSICGLPQESILICFGVDHGSANPRKGADLLLHAFRELKRRNLPDEAMPRLVVFGQQLSLPPTNPEIPYYYLGKMRDDISLRLLYSAADAVVIPSRQDNLPNIGLEAQACGKPVVGFTIGGLPDIIDDGVTGALAEPFDPKSLAEALYWTTSCPDRNRKLGVNARLRAQTLWSESVVAKQYSDLYHSILERQRSAQ
jgi:glycosyltransferase involved in cell wall biosynthesis